MNQSLLVTKRDGRTERINLDKIHRVLDWAAEGLNNVSVLRSSYARIFSFMMGLRPPISMKLLLRPPQT